MTVRRNTAPAAALGLTLLVVAGCAASGPTDFADVIAPLGTPAPATASTVRTPAERDRLESDLLATAGGQASAGRAAAGGTTTSVMALTVIRQQQMEEAEALLREAGACPPAPAAADGSAASAPSAACPPAAP